MNNFWTTDEIEKLKQLMGKISFEEMIKHFSGRSKMSLVHKADKLGLSNTYRFRKYFFNNNFWENLTPTNCYFGGFLAADGCINGRSIVISLATKDVHLLEELKRTSNFTGIIRSYQRKNYKKETFKQVSTLSFNTVGKWVTDLEKHFNIVAKKSLILRPPNISDDLLSLCYIIGYLDGDGWIYRNNKNKLCLGCVSGSYDLLFWIKTILDKYFPKSLRNESRKPKIQQQKKKGKDTNCFYFVFYGSKVAKMIDFFRQFPIFKLDRKWNNPAVLARIEEMKIQHPNFFTLSPELQSIKDQFGNYQFPASTPT